MRLRAAISETVNPRCSSMCSGSSASFACAISSRLAGPLVNAAVEHVLVVDRLRVVVGKIGEHAGAELLLTISSEKKIAGFPTLVVCSSVLVATADLPEPGRPERTDS